MSSQFGPRSQQQSPNYSNQFPRQRFYDRPTASPQFPQSANNPQLTSSLHFFTIGRLENYLERYFTRYRDFYNDTGRFFEGEALEFKAVQELAQRMNVNIQQAAVMILCDNYARTNLPQSDLAKSKLQSWAEYLHIHYSPVIHPSPEQQRYEQQMMEAAETSARDLWDVFKAFSRDPIAWGNQWASQEALRVYEHLERIGDVAHQIWMKENQPHRVPAPAPVVKLNPRASEFLFLPRESRLVESEKKGQKSPADQSCSPDSDTRSSSSTSQSRSDSFLETPSEKSTASSLSLLEAVSGALDGHEKDGFQSAANSPRSADRVENSKNNQTLTGHSFIGTPPTGTGGTSASTSDSDNMKGSQGEASIEMDQDPTSNSEQEGFHLTIMLFSATRNSLPVKALLDTGNEGPNWVSTEIVSKLNLSDKLFEFQQKSKSVPAYIDANGNCIRATGLINLSWQHFNPEQRQYYTKWEEEQFHVLPESSNHIQVIFGAPFLLKHNLVQLNKHAIVPLTANRKMDRVTKQQMDDNLQARDKKKKESRTERIREENEQDASFKSIRLIKKAKDDKGG